MPYVELQKLLDEANAWGSYCYEKSANLEDLSDAAIDVITEHLPGKNSPQSVQLFYRLDGAYSDVEEEATAFGGERVPALRRLHRRSLSLTGVTAGGTGMGPILLGRPPALRQRGGQLCQRHDRTGSGSGPSLLRAGQI